MDLKVTENKEIAFNEVIRKILIKAVILSILLIGAGFFCHVFKGYAFLSWPLTVSGIVILLLMPIVRILYVSYRFIKEKDYISVAVSVFILVLIWVLMMIGKTA